MKAEEWRKSCGEDDAILSACIDDLSESEREAGILRSALAESERLRVEAEAKVAAWTKCVAQSSTQYREMVKALEEYGSHQLPCPLAQWTQGRPTKDGGYETMYAGKWYQDDDKPECTCGFSAALGRSTP